MVIVVIAVLAAISIVAYNGIQDRAKKTATSAAVAQASRQVGLFVAREGKPPANMAEAEVAASAGDVTFTYTTSGNTWCIAGVNGTISYVASSSSSSPKEGDCTYQSVVATLTSPGVMSGVKTIVFVGTMPSTGPHYIFDFRPVDNTASGYLYKYTTGTLANTIYYNAGRSMARLDGDKAVAYTFNPPGNVYVGQRYSLNETWPGSWKAIGFSDVLTNDQVEQVIAKLKTEI